MLRFAPALTIVLFLGPVLVGLAGTLLPAFGYLPAIGATEFSLAPWRALAEAPGFWSALRLSLGVGALASAISLALAVALVAVASGRPGFGRLQGLLAPLLASPHAAIALGLAFVLAPSGWIVRLISPELTGWTRPPTGLATIRDGHGLALTLGLVVKETPYLVIMLVAASAQTPAERLLQSARSMGYGRLTAWLKLVLPRLWPQIRLPVYAVIAYSVSVVDQALVLGPGNPPPLSILALRWFSDYDLALHLPAAAASILQLGLALLAILACYALEAAVAVVGRHWIERGGRGGALAAAMPVLATIAVAALGLGGLALVGLGLWSVTASWPFSRALPAVWSLDAWMRSPERLLASLGATLAIAVAATLAALALCIACLERESRLGRPPGGGVLWLIYLPLLVPQIAFLFGLQIALVRLGLDGTMGAVVAVHLVFVLPYVFLSLSDPWRALDPRYARTAASLGRSPLSVLLRVKLPMLLRPLLIAAAVGVAVSVGQYLATIFAGAGRVATVTTEALALASGADRAGIGVLGFLQALLPLAAFGLALLLPRLVHAGRRGMA